MKCVSGALKENGFHSHERSPGWISVFKSAKEGREEAEVYLTFMSLIQSLCIYSLRKEEERKKKNNEGEERKKKNNEKEERKENLTTTIVNLEMKYLKI